MFGSKIKRNLYYVAFVVLLIGFAMGIAKVVVTMSDSAKKSGQNPVPTVESSGTTEVIQDTTVVALDDLVVVQEAMKVRRNTIETESGARAIDESHNSNSNKPKDTIIGRFRRDIVDTLIAEPTGEPDEQGCYWDRRIYSVSGDIADIPFNRVCYGFYISNVGDLDGNGTDEICIYSHSCHPFTHYDVITYRNGKWCRLIEPVYIYVPDVGGDVVSKSRESGYIKAKALRYCDPEDLSDWETVDSLVKIVRNGEPF